MQTFFQNGDEQVNGDGAPDLGAHGVRAGASWFSAEKMMLLTTGRRPHHNRNGYTPFFRSRQQIKGGQRGQIGEHQFYLKLKNGQEYGQMSIDLHAPFNNQTPGLIRLSYAINPSGSRILR
jgi:hypothetical protein